MQMFDHAQSWPQQTPSKSQKQSTLRKHCVTTSMDPDQISNFDVMLGRGKAKDHHGNINLNQLIALKQDLYKAAQRWEKTVIADEIVSWNHSRTRWSFLETIQNQVTPILDKIRCGSSTQKGSSHLSKVDGPSITATTTHRHLHPQGRRSVDSKEVFLLNTYNEWSVS